MRTRCNRLILIACTLALGACAPDAQGVDDTAIEADVATSFDDADVLAVDEVGAADGVAHDITLSDDASDAQSDAQPDTGPILPPRPWDVTARGPYNIGHRTTHITYAPRAEPQIERKIRLSVWYPTHATEGAVGRYYGGMRRGAVFSNAEPARDEPMPVLVFSHGNSSLAEQSYFMTEFFATHGWLVIAPDHTGNTIGDNQGAINLMSAVYRPQDISASLDWLEALAADDPLYGLASDDEIVLSGHSFGGFTTLAAAGSGFMVDEAEEQCALGEISASYCSIFTPEHVQIFRDGLHDARIGVAIPQTPAGAQIFGERLDAITIPTLLWTGSMDRTLPNEREGDPIWQGLRGEEHLRIDLTHAGHFTFSNMCELLGTIESVRDDGCGPEFIDIFEAFGVINAYSLAFARLHLFGDTADRALLSGERKLIDAMVLSDKR
ncbi:MAG: hypothetical protein H0U74_02280 [Bradymonadaceae bacterium]|nr:hypothetical protein [Lujinxingiaceae bacterium]